MTMNKYTLTCNCFEPLMRADITVEAETLDVAWDKALAKFCRKYKVKKADVNITATHRN